MCGVNVSELLSHYDNDPAHNSSLLTNILLIKCKFFAAVDSLIRDVPITGCMKSETDEPFSRVDAMAGCIVSEPASEPTGQGQNASHLAKAVSSRFRS